MFLKLPKMKYVLLKSDVVELALNMWNTLGVSS